ncbi:uncharacterized protein G2W53_035532 [Senna tora]|uniref:Uncharacterized protein n=1 Tax=Senna tora TaxID=362788 RepID=A0A834W9D6_9FABA|nr:uncharacterized protein G2W53_035532 [Senna tora]
MVDENMIILRMRIQEMKMMERKNYVAPSDWMEWEKQYHRSYEYDSMVMELKGAPFSPRRDSENWKQLLHPWIKSTP